MESPDPETPCEHKRDCPAGYEEQVKAANDDLERSAVFSTGLIQLLCGSTLVIMGIVSMFLGSLYRSGFVLWGALFFPIATGYVGLKAQNLKRNTRRIYTLMSSTSALLSLLLILYDCVALILQQQHCDMDYHDYYAEYATYECHHNTYVVGLHGSSAVVAFMEMVIATAAAVCGCCGCCCVDTTIDRKALEAEFEASGGDGCLCGLMKSTDKFRQPVHLHCA